MPAGCASLDELLSLNYESLVGWCRRIVPPGLEAEDVVHAAYLRLRRSYRQDRGSLDRPLAYLRRSIRWEVADRMRSERRRRQRELATIKLRTPWHERSPLAAAAASEALRSLTGRQRQVCFALMEGKQRSQVCDELQLRPGSLDVYLSRARASLVEHLDLSRAG